MRPPSVLPVPVKAVDARELESRLEKLKDRIRRRAYDLYCMRAGKGNPLDDWTRAENECCAVPIAGIADEENEIRITACVPDASPSNLVVDVLPNEIVIEAACNGELRRYKRFRLPSPIDANGVEAHMHGAELDVIAPKAKNAAAENHR